MNHHYRGVFSRLQIRQDHQHLCVGILKHSFNMYQCALIGDGRKVPVIKEVYDPLTGLRNGTITPNAPVVITGENLCLSSLGTI